jgi:protein-disulfide isomerase
VSNSGQRPTRNEKREAAREHARIAREKLQKQQRRRKFVIQGGVAIVILAIVAVVAVVVVSNNHATVAAAETKAGPKNMLSDGILFNGSGGTVAAVRTAAIKPKGKPVATDESKLTGTANIVEYIDLQCPFCNEFESTNQTQITKWVAAGKATVEIHPIAILDSESEGARYSSRATNAVACVANFDPDDFLAVTKALYANQPKENSSGLPNSKLLSILAGAGAGSSKIAACVNGESFKSWVTASTARLQAAGGPFAGQSLTTPTVFVNGQQWNPTAATALTDPSQFASFVDSVVPGATS